MEVYYLKLIWHLFYISIQKGAVSITILGEKLYSYIVLCTKATCWVICLFPGQLLLLRSPALPTHNYFVPSPSSKPNLCYYNFKWLLHSRLSAFRQRGWHSLSKLQRVPVLGASKFTRSKLQKDDKWVSSLYQSPSISRPYWSTMLKGFQDRRLAGKEGAVWLAVSPWHGTREKQHAAHSLLRSCDLSRDYSSTL